MIRKTIGSKDNTHFYKTKFRDAPGTFQLSEKQLKTLQATLLSILKDLIMVFEKEGINYTLSGGSALGAIRHQGFIPWDDDIDINMPRKDFEHLKKVFDKELSDKYDLCAPDIGEGHGLSLVQIKKKGTVYKSFNELKKKNVGIYVDIFVLENTYDNRIKRTIHGLACLAIGYALTCRKTAEDWEELEKYLVNNKELKRAFKKKKRIGELFKWIPLDDLTKATKCCYSYCNYHNSKFVSIPSGRKHYFGEMYRREDMCEYVDSVFEGLNVRIPKGIDNYMKVLYGNDYMKIPAPEEREAHSVVALEFADEA